MVVRVIPNQISGLILSRQWHDGPAGQSLVYWLSSDEGPLRVEMTGQESVFFIAASDLEWATKVLNGQVRFRQASVSLKCFASGMPAVACYFRNQRDLGIARSVLSQNQIVAFESDVRPSDRFLMERFIQGAMEIEGSGTRKDRYLSFENARIRAVDYQPSLKVVSLDIETSISRKIVISIAIAGEAIEQVFMLARSTSESTTSSLPFVETVATEKALIERFIDWFDECDPDVVIGWSVVGFDLKYLQDRCDNLGIRFALGRDRAEIKWRQVDRGQSRSYAVVPGRVVLDGIELLRTATYNFESFSLEHVSRELLGRGKLVLDVDSRAFEIDRMHEEDQESLARYNLEDCALVLDIFRHADLINFAIQRSRLTGLEMDRQGGSVAAFDFLYLPRLHRAGYVAPVVDEASVVHSPGGYVLDSAPGLYENVIVLDFKSLYPSIIRTFHVDPLAMIAPDEARIPGFLEAEFSKEHVILPRIIEELWQARDEAKRARNAASSQAIKIIMNSFYGVLGTPGCRFFDPRLASSITMRGHEILQKTRDLIEEKGFPVIYGDTDSVFVWVNEHPEKVQEAGAELAVFLNHWWAESLDARYGIASRLEIEFETHFTQFFMPTVRGSDKGSKKRYAGMVEHQGLQKLIFKGLETVRTDWSPLARDFQQELYRLVFLGLPFESYVIETVSDVLAGRLDDKLILRRRLRRKLVDYTKNVPPHVRAARMADQIREDKGLAPTHSHGGWIAYLMTVNGPEPSTYTVARPDYDFYIERQLAPIADAILSFRGTSLATLTDRQLGLF
ncbi:MAG: DNA polymerase-2 [Candidatus Azotimanducaceae bacterium]|jgi:DNA polymerase-2